MNITYTGYTYSGKQSKEWYAKFVMGAPSLDLLRIMPNVKDKMQVPNLNVTGASKAASCTFSAAGVIEIGTRLIDVTTIDINMEYCEADLEVLFVGDDMRPGSNGTGDFTPAALHNMIMEQLVEVVNMEVEEMIWQGDTAGATSTYLDRINGLEKIMAADGNVVPVVGTTLTAANVLVELGKVIAAIPKTMLRRRKNDKVGIAVSQTTYALIIEAKNAATFNPTMITEVPDFIQHLGWKVYPVDGMSDNTMVFADFQRIWVGTDLIGDLQDIRIIAMAETTGD